MAQYIIFLIKFDKKLIHIISDFKIFYIIKLYIMIYIYFSFYFETILKL